jgi:hypothetical protein
MSHMITVINRMKDVLISNLDHDVNVTMVTNGLTEIPI